MGKHHRRNAVAYGTLVLGGALAVAGAAGAGVAAAASSTGATGATGATSAVSASTTARGAKFLAAQKALEASLALRTTQLSKLGTDVSDNSKVLTSSDLTTLTDRLQAETASISGLATQVQSDTTWAELTSARHTMLYDNRVFAVMTPQVFEVIEADTVAGEVSTLEAEEPGLQSAVNSIAGQPGAQNAANHYAAFVKLVNTAANVSLGVSARVLAVIPQQWPNAQHVFVTANRQLLQADLALARAQYDATVIGLATGGYTGS
ncbi:MAG TPA: hypothetical protein VMD59_15455 [Acidimicrobiales bacterium]|nr:hypothetical protein [Acidimicrobiales bacterium]